MVEGRSPAQIRALISAVTHAVATTTDAPLEAIRVVVREVPRTHWAAGDVTLSERESSITGAHGTERRDVLGTTKKAI